ncbi:MAG: YlxR family protein [Deinococcus sp.]
MSAASPTTLTPAPARHVPERSCVACRRRRPQGELLRLSRRGGVWMPEQDRQRSGRGAYLCADSPACWAEKRLRRPFGGQAATLRAKLLATQAPTLPTPTPEPTMPEPSMK